MSSLPTVLVSTFLEPQHVSAIESAFPGIEVLYAPELLPEPRYPGDHGGSTRQLSDAQQQRWNAMLEQAEVAFDFDWQHPERLSERAPKLRWVQATSAGIGAFMSRTGLADTSLVATTAAGIHAVPLAEFALAGVLHFTKGFGHLDRCKQDRHWERYTTEQLAGQTVTVVGLGKIGHQVVRSFRAMGTHVVAVGRPGGSYDLPEDVEVTDTGRLDAVLPRTDALVLCCALTEQTHGLVGAAQLEALPPHAVLVNIARGQVVDEEALIGALESGSLRGACLDVFATEPLPPESPLWGLDNVIVSPHSASTVAAENGLLTELFIDNLRRWIDDRPLVNLYRRDLGY
ncbi:D-2-hydroxyacid dehydrogenase [Nocardioides sp. GCM10023255]